MIHISYFLNMVTKFQWKRKKKKNFHIEKNNEITYATEEVSGIYLKMKKKHLERNGSVFYYACGEKNEEEM